MEFLACLLQSNWSVTLQMVVTKKGVLFDNLVHFFGCEVCNSRKKVNIGAYVT